MAEDDTSGLDLLIRQRMNRPSFTRTISREMSNSSGGPGRRSGKSGQRRKRKETEEESEEEREEDLSMSDSDSEESEYFSAEEFISENQIETDSDNAEESDSNETSCEDTSSGLTSCLELAETNRSSQAGSEQKLCGRSKKQKKKRRRLVKEGGVIRPYHNNAAPFQHEDNINIDFSVADLREEIVSRAENVPAQVLSLSELCAKSIWTKNKRPSALSFQLLPTPLKQAACLQRGSQAFSSRQLSVLFQNFAEMEEAAGFHRLDKDAMTLLVTRNVFSKAFAVKWRGSNHIDPYVPHNTQTRQGGEVTMVIPYSYTNWGVIEVERSNRGVDYARTRLYKTSMMVTALDLMVPSHLRPSRKKEKASPDLEEEDRALVVCADAILRNLQKRFPKTVEECQGTALPYLYWLRGHSRLALQRFLHLSASTEDVREKIFLLLEAAFLCQLQQQPDLARKLFRQSHDLLADTPLARCHIGNRQEVQEQEVALCANTYDQGVLTEEKALQSLSVWQFLLTVPCGHMSAQAAAESLLCFHLSHLPGRNMREKIRHVLNHIKVCVGSCWRVLLHLSLLHAWLGDRFESINMYRRMLIGENIPGQDFKPETMKNTEFSPWLVVCDAVTSGNPVKPLNVVWRTQLGFFRIVSSFDAFYGQMQGLYPGLRLSPEGHLTDDLHLVLPPIQAVNLDLYTGKLLLPSRPGHAHVQRTVFNSCHPERNYNAPDPTVFQYSTGACSLTSTQLYCDDAGRQVHLLTNKGASLLRASASVVAHLRFVSPGGQRKKLNLKQILRVQMGKKVEEMIQSTYASSLKLEKLARKGLNYALSHNLTMASASGMKDIGTFLEMIEKRKRHKINLEHCPEWELKMCPLFKFEVQDFVSYGHTLLICGHVGVTFSFSMFVDVTSKETFSQPVTYITHLKEIPSRDSVYHVLGRQGHMVPRSEVLCVRDFYRSGRLKLYGQGGKCWQQRREGPDTSRCVLGSSVYLIHNPHNNNDDDDDDDDDGNEEVEEGLPTLTELKFYQSSARVRTVQYDPDPELREVKVVADRLLLVLSDGLRILRPDTMEPELILQSPDSEKECPLSDDGVTILMTPVRVTVLAEKEVVSPAGTPTVMVPVAVNDYLLVLGVQERKSAADAVIEVVLCVKVPGHTTECCLVGSAGYILSTTWHHKDDAIFYRETLCHLGPDGRLRGLLPCLGPGPHGFFPLLLPPPPPQGGERGERGEGELCSWHVYLRDGHEGIMDVRL